MAESLQINNSSTVTGCEVKFGRSPRVINDLENENVQLKSETSIKTQQIPKKPTSFHLEGPMFHICLRRRIVKSSTYQSLSICKGTWAHIQPSLFDYKECICFEFSPKIVISNQAFRFSKRYIAWCCSISLIICDNFHFPMLKNSNTRIRGTKIDSNCWSFRHVNREKKVLSRINTTQLEICRQSDYNNHECHVIT
ncbi:hypothetical protein pdam_00000610 [Pocillopora damicornis]|uniref:Uncharacterized protein n=1 Tax=Pocillopora damicornis TaxID=46731 RepID=A0A3M6TYD1_POCDA|nr:hypothetical protein pdam_00000610 [Pocillopora damicornis]